MEAIAFVASVKYQTCRGKNSCIFDSQTRKKRKTYRSSYAVFSVFSSSQVCVGNSAIQEGKSVSVSGHQYVARNPRVFIIKRLHAAKWEIRGDMINLICIQLFHALQNREVNLKIDCHVWNSTQVLSSYIMSKSKTKKSISSKQKGPIRQILQKKLLIRPRKNQSAQSRKDIYFLRPRKTQFGP